MVVLRASEISILSQTGRDWMVNAKSAQEASMQTICIRVSQHLFKDRESAIDLNVFAGCFGCHGDNQIPSQNGSCRCASGYYNASVGIIVCLRNGYTKSDVEAASSGFESALKCRTCPNCVDCSDTNPKLRPGYTSDDQTHVVSVPSPSGSYDYKAVYAFLCDAAAAVTQADVARFDYLT
eukprot:COSAG01_NODE_34038_length_554_cov_2.457143_1_plen_179_part_01